MRTTASPHPAPKGPRPCRGHVRDHIPAKKVRLCSFHKEDAVVKHAKGQPPIYSWPDCDAGWPGARLCLSPPDLSPNEFSCLTTGSRQGQAWRAPAPGHTCTGFSGHWFNACALSTQSVMQLTSVTLFPALYHAFLQASWKIFPGEEAGVTVTWGQSQHQHSGQVEPPCWLPSCLLWSVGSGFCPSG